MANKQDGLVTRLSRTREVILQDGVETIIKPVPDADVTEDLDPRVLAVIQGYDASEPETSFDLASARASMGWPNRDMTTMDITTDHVMIPNADGDIPARLYRPRTEETLPAILFFHGGGFFGGTLDTVENPCKLLAEKANALVVSVDETGTYDVTITAKSDAGELAQMPVTLFANNIPGPTFTFNGTDGEWVTQTKQVFFLNQHNYLQLYFALGGLDVKDITFTLVDSFSMKNG